KTRASLLFPQQHSLCRIQLPREICRTAMVRMLLLHQPSVCSQDLRPTRIPSHLQNLPRLLLAHSVPSRRRSLREIRILIKAQRWVPIEGGVFFPQRSKGFGQAPVVDRFEVMGMTVRLDGDRHISSQIQDFIWIEKQPSRLPTADALTA